MLKFLMFFLARVFRTSARLGRYSTGQRFTKKCASPIRLGLIAFSAFLLTQLWAWGPAGHPFGIPFGYGQVVTNEAGASFQDASGTTGTTVSNGTQIQAPGSPDLTIIKTADRGAAEPGDVVVYQLLITNPSDRLASPITVTDDLPLGLQLLEESIRTSPFEVVSVSTNGTSFTLDFGDAVLEAGESLRVVYAALITPDAVRGDGRNIAQVATPDNSSTATFQLAIRPGILADCGTIVGRVFVDKNFDGEQQPGEPGVPNAVLFLDDGNRILTDPEGLFSIVNVLSGNRVGTLDLSSLPGYTLAPNLYRISDNSQSRLVRLTPGGLARMNFGVTPAFGEG